MVDVVSKRCDFSGCTTQAKFGLRGDRPSRCHTHMAANMVNVMSKRCEHMGCMIQAHFGFEVGRPTRCCDHQLPGMDLNNDRCISCKLTFVQKKGGLCAPCRQFRDSGGSEKTICKERAIVDMLLESGLVADDAWTAFNKSIGASCGGYRPDILIDEGTHVVVIEIDEFQHRPRVIGRVVDGVTTTMVSRQYSPDCETVRVLNILQSVQAPMRVIRFNPDAFKVDGKTIKIARNVRHAALRDQIRTALSAPPASMLVITYMYYDGAEIRTETPDLPVGF
jgi:hypothetical protein